MNVDTLGAQLLFTTVRLVNDGPTGQSIGTGFIIDGQKTPDLTAPMLVTNKHVIEGAATLDVQFIAADPVQQQQPLLGQLVTVRVEDPAVSFTGHPDPTVDVAVLPLAAALNAVAGRVYYKMVPWSLLPTPEGALELDAIEEVTFIGYPNGHSDPLNLTPITRRGITATPIALNFGGRPTFLLDGSVFGGSSGSPVFIFNQGSYPVRGGVAMGSRVLLVGIVAETLLRHQQAPIRATTGPHAVVAQELNLGVAFTWRAIDEAIDAVYHRSGEAR